MVIFKEQYDLFYDSKDKFLKKECIYVLINGNFNMSELNKSLKDMLDPDIAIQRV